MPEPKRDDRACVRGALARFAFVLGLLFALATTGRGATFIWDGGHAGQDNWSFNQNWNPNGAPTNNGTADLVFSGSIRLTPEANGTWSVNSLTFDPFAGAFTLLGDTVTLQGAGVESAITNNATYAATITNALVLGSTQTWAANSEDLAFSGPVALGSHTLTLSGSADTSASGAISGAGSLVKTGSGSLLLSGANTYSGGTTVSAGTVQGSTTSLQGNIVNNATVVFDQATAGTFAGSISGSGSLVKQNAGTVTLATANTYSGTTTISGGALVLGAANALADATEVTVGSGASLQLAAAAQTIGSLAGAGDVSLGAFTLTAGGANTSTVFSGQLSGTGALVKTGDGTLTLSGTNTYSGGTTVAAGTLQVTTASLPGSITNNAALVFDQATAGTFAGVISGTGSLTKQNTGTLTLTGINTYSGATNILGGTLVLGATDTLVDTTAITIASGATLALGAASETVGSVAGAGAIDLGAYTLTVGGTHASTSHSGSITGTGGLVKTGSGTLTLSGANSYSGGTVVSGGTLSGTTTSLQGNISNNAAVVFDQSTNGTYAGAITGGGSLIKQGSGTVVMTGANSHTGGTTVSAGTLQGDTSSLQGNIANNATVVFDQSGTGTFAGVIFGTGSVTKQNSGTLLLSGANTYSGGTTVTAGTLQGSTTSIQGNVTNNAIVVFDQSADGTYAGAMSGTGSLVKQNVGTLTLSGTNTYTGGTTVTAGTLVGSTASLQGNIANNGAVVFEQASGGSYAGVMSGTGSLRKTGAGTLTLSGTNTYAGGTTVTAGTLQGTTSSIQGNITNDGAVVFDQTTNGTFAGAISGTGALTKQNSGTVTLTGTNTYTGTTTVSGGALAIGANNATSSASTLSLAPTATFSLGGYSTEVGTLSYHASILDFGAAGTTNYFLFNGGGASTGTLTINNYSAAEGDVFAFRTGASGVDTAFVSGVYFYGIGAGVLGSTNQTISGYSGTWDVIAPNSAAFTTWDGGGNNNSWSTDANWSDDTAPASGPALRIALDGTTRLSPSLNANYTLNTLRFNASAGAFSLSGTGTNTLTFDGVVPSIIQLSSNAQAISAPVSLATTIIAETTGAGSLTVSGEMSGAGGLTKVGDQTLILAGANTYTGETLVSAGTLVLRDGSGLGSTAAGTSVSSAATLQLENGISVGAEALTLEGILRNASGANTYSGTMSGSGVVIIDGGSLTLAGATANTYRGTTTVNSGTLALAKSAGDAVAAALHIGNGTGSATVRLQASNQISDTSAVVLHATGAPILDLGGFSETVGSLASGNSGAAVQLGAGSLVVGGDNSSTTFAGVISGSAGSLTKLGTGTFTLAGANTFGGATNLNAGALVVTHDSALGSSAGGTTVAGGATLQLENNVSIGAEALTLAGTLVNASGANAFAGAISGSGSVLLNAGTLTLAGSGANTFTGTTTVNSGTLELGKSSGATAVSGDLAIGNGSGTATVRLLAGNQISDTVNVSLHAGGAPVLNLNNFAETVGSLSSTNAASAVQLGSGSLAVGANNASTTFAGVISGSGGALTKTGSGTLTLSGANSYSGGTTVSAGILQGTTASLQGNITNNASVIFDQPLSGTYAGVMSGTGTLTKQNAGTLILSGANTYSGGTTVTSGTLQGSSTSLQGNITNNAAVIFDQAGSGTYAGAMSGTGSLTKQNSGTLVLSGVNSYSGGTLVSGGTLQGSATSLQGNITNQASVVFNQSSTGTFAGAIAGTGSVTKQNTGTLILTGANTYTGGTTVAAGTLQGNTTSIRGNITNQAAVVFDQAASGTYSGVISGSGSVTKQNSGTLTITAANTYTGGTTVAGGRLVLGLSDALSAASNLALGSGSTLSLNGTSSQRVNALTFTNATVDFGTTGTANHFLLSSVGSTTGTLTISNWTSGSDVFGVATNNVSQAFLDNVFFAGINVGMGAVIASTPTTIGSYGTFYALTPIPTFTWSGGQNTGNTPDRDNWSKSLNWIGGIAPAVGAVKSLVMAGSFQTTNDMDGAYLIKGLLFRSDAAAFTINSGTGDTLTIGGAGIINESTSTQTLNVPVALSASQTWDASIGSLVMSGSTILNGANTLTVTGAFDTTISAAIGSGSGGLVKTGSGTLTLGGANTFTGGVSINAGVLAISSDGNLGATGGTVTFNGGTLRTTAGLTLGRSLTLGTGGGTFDSAGVNSTLSGVISGSGGLTKIGSGTLTLSGINTFTGGLSVNAGTVAVSSDAQLGATTGALRFGGGTLRTDAAITSSRTITLNAGGGTIDSAGFTHTFSGAISGVGSFTKTGAGTVILAGANTYSGGTTVSAGTLQGSSTSLRGNIVNHGAVVFDQAANGTFSGSISGTGSVTKLNSGTLTLAGAGSYTGATTIDAGTLVLGTSGALGSTTALTISSGAMLDVNHVTQTIGSLTGVGQVALGTGRLSIGSDNTSSVFGGEISGAGVVEKIGSGTLTFNNNMSFVGELKLTSGSLVLGGISLTVGTLRISGNTILDFGNSISSVLTATNVIVENGATLTINNWVHLQDFFYVNGTLVGLNTGTWTTTPAGRDVRGSSPTTQIQFTGFPSNSTVWQSYDSQITPAPEPSTYGALCVGAAMALFGLRRWKRAHRPHRP